MKVIDVKDYFKNDKLKSFIFEPYWNVDEIYLESCSNFDELELLYFKLNDATYLKSKYNEIEINFKRYYTDTKINEDFVINETKLGINKLFKILIENAKNNINLYNFFELFSKNSNELEYDKYEFDYKKYDSLAILSPWLRVCAVGILQSQMCITGGFIKSSQAFQDSKDGRIEIDKFNTAIKFIIINKGNV